MSMLLLKLAVTIVFVTGLSLVAERVSPRAAGVLSAYPAGTAISLFFIGLEQGAQFAGRSAPYNVAGITAMLAFLFAYALVAHRVGQRWRSIAAAALAGSVAYTAVAAVLYLLQPAPLTGVLFCVLAITTAIVVGRRIADAGIARRVQLGPLVLLYRAAVAALVIIAITGAAQFVEPELAGLLSAFPATAFPLIVIVHSTYGAAQARTIIKNFPKGAGALVVYSLTVALAYPRWGVGWGTLTAFAAATLYLLATLPLAFRKTAIIESKYNR